jgi:hypothetical protein
MMEQARSEYHTIRLDSTGQNTIIYDTNGQDITEDSNISRIPTGQDRARQDTTKQNRTAYVEHISRQNSTRMSMHRKDYE